jgi:hypothetical protein
MEINLIKVINESSRIKILKAPNRFSDWREFRLVDFVNDIDAFMISYGSMR